MHLSRYDEKTESMSLHRLKQEVIRNGLENPLDKRQAVLTFLTNNVKEWVSLRNAQIQIQSWDTLRIWEPNALWFLEYFSEELQSEKIAIITSVLGNWKYIRGDYKGCEELYKQTLEMRQKFFGKEHPDVAITMGDLGCSLYTQGKYEEAKAFLLPSIRDETKIPWRRSSRCSNYYE